MSPPDAGDWSGVRVFGAPPADKRCIIRPCAYALIVDPRGRLAVVRTKQGVILPGGGIESGESPAEAIVREAREECGFTVTVGAWSLRVVQFVNLASDSVAYEKRSFICDAAISGLPQAPTEIDHELRWLEPSAAMAALSYESQRWAARRRLIR